jgi:hypothetical protein
MRGTLIVNKLCKTEEALDADIMAFYVKRPHNMNALPSSLVIQPF